MIKACTVLLSHLMYVHMCILCNIQIDSLYPHIVNIYDHINKMYIM